MSSIPKHQVNKKQPSSEMKKIIPKGGLLQEMLRSALILSFTNGKVELLKDSRYYTCRYYPD